MNLGFHYHIPVIRKGDALYTPGYIGLFLDSIAPLVGKLVLFAHTPSGEEASRMDYQLQSKNISLVDIGTHNSIMGRYKRWFQIKKIIAQNTIDLDFILIRASTPLLPVFPKVFSSKKIGLYLVSDATNGLDNLNQPQWRLLLIKIWANWYKRKERQLAKKALTVVNSQMLYDELTHLKHLHLLKTTTLSKNDFLDTPKEFTRTDKPIKLLFTGRITKIKGLFDIVQAMKYLHDEGITSRLDLVGMVDEKDTIIEDLQNFSKEIGLGESVSYLGYRSAGTELLKEYRKADFFVIASQASSEGFPRTLWEAMASKLPIIATKVSSIPYFAKGVAFLAEPKNPTDFANQLKTAIFEKEKRTLQVAKGVTLAQQNTLEKRGQELIEIIENYRNK